jgi:hypothetical protein
MDPGVLFRDTKTHVDGLARSLIPETRGDSPRAITEEDREFVRKWQAARRAEVWQMQPTLGKSP